MEEICLTESARGRGGHGEDVVRASSRPTCRCGRSASRHRLQLQLHTVQPLQHQNRLLLVEGRLGCPKVHTISAGDAAV